MMYNHLTSILKRKWKSNTTHYKCQPWSAFHWSVQGLVLLPRHSHWILLRWSKYNRLERVWELHVRKHVSNWLASYNLEFFVEQFFQNSKKLHQLDGALLSMLLPLKLVWSAKIRLKKERHKLCKVLIAIGQEIVTVGSRTGPDETLVWVASTRL